jgi:D-cysteine desulfhydrase
VAPLGSGGTVAGIAAGLSRRGLSCRVLAVQVVAGIAPRLAVRWLLRRLESRLGPPARARDALSRIVFDAEHVGGGYGFPTAAGERATELAGAEGLALEPTYTAKAFAAALDLLAQPGAHGVHLGRPLRVLYWHTFSATELGPLLDGAPSLEVLPSELSRLLR